MNFMDFGLVLQERKCLLERGILSTSRRNVS